MRKITYETANSKQTQKLGEILAQELEGGEVICLLGDLGSGKTTFTQGLLKGLKIKGPHTSPTFLIMKEYKISEQGTKNKERHKKINVYHIDAYRIKKQDILNLGWEEIISNPQNTVIIEWADRIKKIIPARAVWIKFEWLDENKRKILFKSKG